MRCAESYQDIESPYDEEEILYEQMMNEYAAEFDPEEAGSCRFSTYMSNCSKLARERIKNMRN